MEHQLTIPKTARYFSKGAPTADKLLVVLHGYSQLARYFIEKFNDLDESWYVVAPEGLHRFYNASHSGRVGASWMTKEDRETDIADNLVWMQELMGHLTTNQSYKEIVMLGFSQGAATAARYFYSDQTIVNRLIVWASVFPPDIDQKKFFSNGDKSKGNFFVIGNTDEFFDAKQQIEVINFYKSLGFTIKRFDGKHDISIKTLKNIL